MKIKNEYVVGEVKEIKPKIFAVSIKNHYQRTMLFCRYQEFYESPYNEIRGKFFSWEKFMMVYKTKRKENTFTYPIDWAGFNIPSEIIEKAIREFNKDKGPYDEIMNNIWFHCENYPLRFDQSRTKWYLIGADTFNSSTMNHEIAHGLYYTNKQYKKICDSLIKDIKPNHYEKLRKKLISIGYVNTKKIIDDEIQAFMSTGLYKGLDTKELKKYEKGFIENFRKFSK
jgi:predicted nucleic-acid-binding Zn-ribbon protein